MNSTVNRTFASLSVRNYRRFFSAQVVSWTGTWIQWVAQAWLVLEITGSGAGLGIVTALQWLPILLLGAWGGVLADRFNKRTLLVFTNSTAAVLSLILGIATLTGWVTLWFVILIALALGVVTSLDFPTRQSFTIEMVGRDRLTNAVSLNTATFTTARVLGPATAGLMIEHVGIGECFLLNAASFIPIIYTLVTMDRQQLLTSSVVERSRGQIREGLRYVASVPVLKTLLLMMAIIGTLQYNFQVILPLLARQTFGGGAGTFGILGAVLGFGMFAGSLSNAAFGRSSKRFLLTAAMAFGAFTLLLAASPTLWMAVLVMVPLGAASQAFLATMNSTLQLTSSDRMRGRVMALYTVLFLGSTPIGAPIVGTLAEAFSPRAALMLAGAATLTATAYGLRRLPDIGGRSADAPAEEELARHRALDPEPPKV